jgi:hypothetical protein
MLRLTTACVKDPAESAETSTKPPAGDRIVLISDSLEAHLFVPDGEAAFPVVLMVGQLEGSPKRRVWVMRAISRALQQRGFALAEIRRRRIGGIAGLFRRGPRMPPVSELEKAPALLERTNRVDPGRVSVVGTGDSTLSAIGLAAQSTCEFLIVVADPASGTTSVEAMIQGEGGMPELLGDVQTTVLCLVVEGDSGSEAGPLKEALVSALEKGKSRDYTVKITRSADRDSLVPFLDRWLQARF